MTKGSKVDVLTYMTRENRPYGLNDIATALKKSHGKTAISRAIDDLVLEGSLVEKTYGKQKVYVVPQDKLPRANDSDLKTMDEKIDGLSCQIQKLKDRIKVAESELKSIQSSLSLEEARKQNADIENEIAELKKSIAECSSDVPIPPEEFTKVEINQKSAVAEWRKRKRMAMDIIDAIAEGYPKSRKQLMEDIGIETDEDKGVSIADFTNH